MDQDDLKLAASFGFLLLPVPGMGPRPDLRGDVLRYDPDADETERRRCVVRALIMWLRRAKLARTVPTRLAELAERAAHEDAHAPEQTGTHAIIGIERRRRVDSQMIR